MRWILLIPIVSTLVYAGPPVFTNYPRSHSKTNSIHNELKFCGETDGEDDVIYWELLDEKTGEFKPVAWEACISVPSGLGIKQMGEDPSITYRVCASNNDGITCARDSRFTVEEKVGRIPGATYRRIPRRRRHSTRI